MPEPRRSMSLLLVLRYLLVCIAIVTCASPAQRPSGTFRIPYSDAERAARAERDPGQFACPPERAERDSLGRPWAYEFQVELPAEPIPDGWRAPSAWPADSPDGPRGEILVQYVIDTLGVPDLASLQVLQTDAPGLEARVRQRLVGRRFLPAESTLGCKIRQAVQQPFAF